MAKVLNSIAFDLPSAPLEAAVNDTFTFEGTPGFTGSGGVQRYDWKWEVDDGGGYVTIASATGLTTADTNPVTNSNSQSANSITVTCSAEGTYTIRMAGAPSTGGSYTVLSSTQTVTVTDASVVATPGVKALTTATFIPTVTATQNMTTVPLTHGIVTVTFAPTVAITDNKLVIPPVAALTTSPFAPVVTAGGDVSVVPGVATLTSSPLAPVVTATANQVATPGFASLVLTPLATVVTATANRVATPLTAALTLTTYRPYLGEEGGNGTYIGGLRYFTRQAIIGRVRSRGH